MLRPTYLMLLSVVTVTFAMIAANSDVNPSAAKDDGENSSLKHPVKRNVAWVARSGQRKFSFDPRSYKRNMAWIARSGGLTEKKSDDGKVEIIEEPEYETYLEPLDENDAVDYDHRYDVEKRNLAALVNSRTIPSFLAGNKRHVGSAMRSFSYIPNRYYGSPGKRYFASLLKSEIPPPSIYPRTNRRYNYFGTPSKRFFNNLLENSDSAPGEGLEKRNLASMINRQTPYSAGKTFQENGMLGKRFYSSLLDNTKNENKRFVASLLKSNSLDDVPYGSSNEILGTMYDRQGNSIEKRYLASLINRDSPYQSNKNLVKRHISSIRGMNKRDYDDDDLAIGNPNDKRTLGSLLKSSSFHQPEKKHIGSAMRFRAGKRDPNYGDSGISEEELELEALEKRFLGSLRDDRPDKRHFASLLDSDGDYFSERADPMDKRFVGSLLDADTAYAPNNYDKRYLGSAINSRMKFMNEDKRFVGSTINSRMNYVNGADKRFLGSALHKRSDDSMISSDDENNTQNLNISSTSEQMNPAEEKNPDTEKSRAKRSANNSGLNLDVDQSEEFKHYSDDSEMQMEEQK